MGAAFGRLRQARNALRDVRRGERPVRGLRRLAHVHPEPVGLRRRGLRHLRAGRSGGKRDVVRGRLDLRTARERVLPFEPRGRPRAGHRLRRDVRPRLPRDPALRRRQRRRRRELLSHRRSSRARSSSSTRSSVHARAGRARNHERLRARAAHVGHGPVHRVRRRERRRQRGRRHLGRQLPRLERDRGPRPDSFSTSRARRTSRRTSRSRTRRPRRVTVTLTYTASSAFSGQGSGTLTTTLGARQQLVQANALSYLRGLGLAIPTTGNQGGTLLVTGAVAQARTSNPNPDTGVGGSYGLSYPAVPASATRAGRGLGLRPAAGRGRAQQPRDRGRPRRKRRDGQLRRRRLRRRHRVRRRPSRR